jgi:hypothetical protein
MEQEKRKIVTIQPLAVSKKLTKFSNDVIDHIMPRVSPNAWKVLTVIVRQTVGWVEDRQTMKRKDWDEISYSQFSARTGIGSSETIRRAFCGPCCAAEWKRP